MIPRKNPVFPKNWAGWPGGKKFAVCITHDVEGIEGFNKIQDLIELNLQYGFRTSFNFVPEGDYEVKPLLINKIRDTGFEIGVHDLNHDGKLYASLNGFIKKAHRINQYLHDWNASGFRSAFMLHNLSWMHHLQIQYDASTFDCDPFEPQPDGINSILPLWIEDKRSIHGGFVELPYTMPQDSTLFLVLGQKTIDTWKRKLTWIIERGGLMLIIVHPDYMCFNGKPGKFQYCHTLYSNLLGWLNERYKNQFWQPLAKDLSTYVMENKSQFQRMEMNP